MNLYLVLLGSGFNDGDPYGSMFSGRLIILIYKMGDHTYIESPPGSL
jgi:hypothetical protein